MSNGLERRDMAWIGRRWVWPGSVRLGVGRTWIGGLAWASAACLAYAAFLSPTRAAEPERQPPRVWAIERCLADQCEIMAWRYSGPTACAVDISSERIAKQMPTGVKLVCVQKRKEQ